MKKVIILGVIVGLIIYSCSSESPKGEKKEFAKGIKEYNAGIAETTAFTQTGINDAGVVADRELKKSDGPIEEVESRGVVHLTKESFLREVVDYESNPNEWVYKGKMPAVIDFYADWCRPCKITAPIIEELAKEYAGKVQFYKIDVQHEQELASVFGIQNIPTFLFIPMKDNPVMSSGIAQTPEQTKTMFEKQIDEILIK